MILTANSDSPSSETVFFQENKRPVTANASNESSFSKGDLSHTEMTDPRASIEFTHSNLNSNYNGKIMKTITTNYGYPDTVTSAVTTGILSDEHYKMLSEDSAISKESIEARGYFTQTDEQALKLLGFKGYQANTPALVIPVHKYNGEISGYIIRPDIPRNDKKGKPIKYESPEGSEVVLDIPPRVRELISDPKIPLIITEGAKKADAAASHDLCTINLNGAYGFRNRNIALPDWEFIALKGRAVYICFDSDVSTNGHVATGMEHLRDLLKSRGAIVNVIYLPEGPNGEKTGLDDYFARGGKLEYLFTHTSGPEGANLSKQTQRKRKRAERMAELKAIGLPIIETHDCNLPDVLTPLSNVIEQHNSESPKIFQRSGQLYEISTDDKGQPFLDRVLPDRLKTIAGELAVWVDNLGTSNIPKKKFPPIDVINQYMVSKDYWKGIPTIRRIEKAPYLGKDGTIHQELGFDDIENIWLSLPDDYNLPNTTPTQLNVDKSLALIKDHLLKEVAFADKASLANAIGLMFLPFVLPYIEGLDDGRTPIHIFDAPTQSSGKTYAAQTCLLPYGEIMMTSDKSRAEESEKEIFGLLLKGNKVIFIDNVKSTLSNATIASSITSGSFEGRILGSSQILRVDTNVVWAATSNNAQLHSDIVSRLVLIRLNTNLERPEERKFTKNPIRFIRHNRADVHGAIITLIRAWLAKGKPERTQKVSRFPAYERVIGGILESLGINEFLDNYKNAQEISDTQTILLHTLIEAWYHTFKDEPVKSNQLLHMKWEGKEEFEDMLGGSTPSLKLGKMLQSVKDQVINGKRIEKVPVAGGARSACNRWRVIAL